MSHSITLTSLLVAASAQYYTISTIAGSAGTNGFVDGVATSSLLFFPDALFMNGTSKVILTDTSGNRVRVIDVPGNRITTLAGKGGANTECGDGGPATSACLCYPQGVALDAFNNLYISDTCAQRIRMVNSSGFISTIVGTGTAGFNGDSLPANATQLSNPTRLAFDAHQNLLVADVNNNRVRRLNFTSGLVTTIAGTGVAAFSGDGGAATSAAFNAPVCVAVNFTSGDMWISDQSNHRIRVVVASTGIVRTVAGSGVAGFSGDGGPASSSVISGPSALALGPGGNIFFVDAGNVRVRMIVVATSVITTIAGGGSGNPYNGELALSAGFWTPTGLAAGTDGAVYVSDNLNSVVEMLTYVPPSATPTPAPSLSGTPTPTPTPTSTFAGYYTISTIVGTSATGFNGDGLVATTTQLNTPYGGICFNGTTALLFTDSGDHRARALSLSLNTVTTLAGSTFSASFCGDNGPGTSGCLAVPQGIVINSANTVFIADTGNSRIRKVSSSGTLTTVAGTGVNGFAGDGGPGTAAQLNNPFQLAINAQGNVLIADAGNSMLRRLDVSTGVLSTVAGTGIAGFSGDGGPAVNASFNEVFGVAVNISSGDMWVCDFLNNRLRVISAATGIVRTVAGTGLPGYSGDGGAATSAQLYHPNAIALASNGDAFVVESGNNCVRVVVAALSLIFTVGGSGNFASGFGGDGGLAVFAQFNNPTGIAIDAGRNVYVLDSNNARVRLLTFVPPSPTTTPTPSPTTSSTLTSSSTPTPSLSSSLSQSRTVTSSATPSLTSTPPPTPSLTITALPTVTRTVTSSATPSLTSTPPPTPSLTITALPTVTPTASASVTPSGTVGPSGTSTSAATSSISASGTPRASTTGTASPSPSPSPMVQHLSIVILGVNGSAVIQPVLGGALRFQIGCVLAGVSMVDVTFTSVTDLRSAVMWFPLASDVVNTVAIGPWGSGCSSSNSSSVSGGRLLVGRRQLGSPQKKPPHRHYRILVVDTPTVGAIVNLTVATTAAVQFLAAVSLAGGNVTALLGTPFLYAATGVSGGAPLSNISVSSVTLNSQQMQAVQPAQSSPQSGNSQSLAIGVGVGVGGAVLIAVAVLFLVLSKRSRAARHVLSSRAASTGQSGCKPEGSSSSSSPSKSGQPGFTENPIAGTGRY